MAPPLSPSAGGGDPSGRPPSPRASKSMHKWILGLCWLAAMAGIWFSPDGGEEMDPTFDGPGREARPNNAPPAAGGDGIVEDGIGIADGPERGLPEGGVPEDEMIGAEGGNAPTSTAAATQSTNEPSAGKETTNEAATKIGADAHQFTDLPEALRPITYQKCCVPAAYKDTYHPTDVDCFGTCFNERACNDTAYPFSSAEEKALFPQAKIDKKEKKELREECQSPESLVPPMEWCQKPYVETENGTPAAHLVRGIPPAGCTHTTHGGGSGAFQHVIIFPSAKLAFCGIPKVGITQWEQFLRMYMGAKDYPSLPHYKLDRNFLQFDLLDPSAQRRVWEDEEWTWAAFVRDPVERILSAYLDKVKSKTKFKWLNGSMAFEEFVDQIASPANYTSCKENKNGLNGLNWCSDPHWRPQIYSCGLSERLDRFEFIGDLGYAAEHTKELLGHVGLWESHGKRFINGGVKLLRNPWCNIASHPHNHTVHIGFQQPDDTTNKSAAHVVYGHARGSKNKIDKYYTPELLKKVQEELYADDHKLWKLVNANGDKLSKGKELMTKLSSKCSSGDVDSSTNAAAADTVSREARETGDAIQPLQPDNLVEALKPVTSNKCCIPAVYKKTKNPKDVACFGTCFTERACNDKSYPFSSSEEKALFPQAKIDKKEKKKLKEECHSPPSLVPPVEWCQKPYPEVENAAAEHLVGGIPPAGCVRTGHSGGSGAFQHVIIFPSAKLAFCGIPKVGITQWEQFLRMYMGAKDYPSLPHYKLDRDFLQFDLLHPSAQRRIWEDEEWTWAAIIRNPAERLLSAYLDKVRKIKSLNGSETFEDVVNMLATPANYTHCKESSPLEGLNWCSDPHWRPQVYSCGLSERIDRFQFIGDIEYAAEHTRELLGNVGLWESHGKRFINGEVKIGRSPFCSIASHPFNHTVHVGFQQPDEARNKSAAQVTYGHAKGSKEKLGKYYTPELLKKVQEELYANDYKLWKLVNANGDKLSKGTELMTKLSSKCVSKPSIGAAIVYQ